MKIYTVISISRDETALVLYCGNNKDLAEEVKYLERADEPSPDKDDATKWVILESEFPDWG